MSDETLTTEYTETHKARQEINALTEIVIGCAIEVHRALRPGLLESTDEMCLCRELSLRSILFERQKPIPVVYKAIHAAQLLGYLKLSGMKIAHKFQRTHTY